MEIHMISITYAALHMRAQTEKTKQTWRWTYSALRYFLDTVSIYSWITKSGSLNINKYNFWTVSSILEFQRAKYVIFWFPIDLWNFLFPPLINAAFCGKKKYSRILFGEKVFPRKWAHAEPLSYHIMICYHYYYWVTLYGIMIMVWDHTVWGWAVPTSGSIPEKKHTRNSYHMKLKWCNKPHILINFLFLFKPFVSCAKLAPAAASLSVAFRRTCSIFSSQHQEPFWAKLSVEIFNVRLALIGIWSFQWR